MTRVAFYDPLDLHPGELLGVLVARTNAVGIIDNKPVRRRAVPYTKFDLYSGDDRELRVYVKDGDLDIINLTGATVVLTVKKTKGGAVLFSKSTANPTEGTIGSPDEGEAIFYIVPADTSSLDSPDQYVYDVEVTTAAGKKYTVLEGLINLLEPVA